LLALKSYIDKYPIVYAGFSLRKMLGTRYGPVGTRFLWL